jgi:hypothetical protein
VRLSLASLDSGPEPRVYGGEPSAPDPGGKPPGGGPGATARGRLQPPIGGLPAPRGDTRHHGHRGPGASRAGHSGCAAPRGNLHAVGRRPAKRKMVSKGHPCIHAAYGDLMTWFASSAATRGLWSPSPLTDVHGREG